MSLDKNVLYERAKQSDMVQGLLDTVELLDLEVVKITRMYPSNILYNNSSFISTIQQLRSQSYYYQAALQELRQRGL